jgi:hypothetical protein
VIAFFLLTVSLDERRVCPRFRLKIEIESKISFRLEVKRCMIALASHRSEIAKIESENEQEISKKNSSDPCFEIACVSCLLGAVDLPACASHYVSL